MMARPNTPIRATDVKPYTNTRVRMVVMLNERLDVDQILVADLVGVARRVDGVETYEAILIDVSGHMHAVALRRIRSINPYAQRLPPLFHLVANPGGPTATHCAELTQQGGHLNEVCHRCGVVLTEGRAHLHEVDCRKAANDAAEAAKGGM